MKKDRTHAAPLQQKLTDPAFRAPATHQMQADADQSAAVRQLRKLGAQAPVQREDVIDEANRGYKHKSDRGVDEMADSLSGSIPEFEQLRGSANKENQKVYGKDLGYKPVPKGQMSTAAHFKDGDAFFAMNTALGQILSNIIFETANAAQGGRFTQVEAHYNDKSIMTKSPKDYGVDDLPGALQGEWDEGDRAARRSLIQERMEYDSLMLAGPSIKATYAKLTDDTAQAAFSTLIDFLEYDFATYYEKRGKSHRALVEKAIRESEKKSESWWTKCYLTSASLAARGLPDTCEELQILRAFRDGHLMRQMDGPALILRYYKRAPAIVTAIEASPSRKEDYEQIFQEAQKCCTLILGGKYADTVASYRALVEQFEDRYLEAAQPPAE